MADRIGIDLDNTIIFYGNLFHGLAVKESWIDETCPVEKDAIKKNLKQRSDDELGELRWQQLQAWAYGKHIGEAGIFDGLATFIHEARTRGDKIFIISHKTKFSNYDPTVNLHQMALKTLSERGFFNPMDSGGLGFTKEDVFFSATLEEKIEKIENLNVSFFIDDLVKVLSHKKFPIKTRGIHFCTQIKDATENWQTFSDWHELAGFFQLFHLFQSELGSIPKKIKVLGNPGNNKINRVTLENGKEYVVKRYLSHAANCQTRMKADFGHLKALWTVGFRNIPQPIFSHDHHAVFSFVEAKPLKKIEENEINQVLDFLYALNDCQVKLHALTKLPASDSRNCPLDYLSHINKRWKKIAEGCLTETWGKEVISFLKNQLSPVRDYLEKKFYKDLDCNGIDPKKNLTMDQLFFSPSDFGFHNILADEEGMLFFFDFEYSGWDDPAKLIADFFHHVGQKVPWEFKWHLLNKFASKRALDPEFLQRWNIVVDLVGLEWILIVLNIADPKEMQRKQFARPGLEASVLIRERLNKANELIAPMKKRMRSGENFISIPPKP